MLSRRMIVALAACAMLSSSTVFAGGGNGGSKSEPIIRVSNGSGGPILAFLNPDDKKVAALAAIAAVRAPTTAEIDEAGGKLVNSGQHHDFKVKVGSYTLAAGGLNVNPAAAPKVLVATQGGKESKFLYTSLVQLLPYN